MQKIIAVLSCALLISCAHAQKLEKIWETDAVVAIPESVLPDQKNNTLYVSLIDGNAWEKDGKGGIAKLSADGRNYDSTWVTGLDAPKGLGMYNGNLYAADISNVVVISIKEGKVTSQIAVPEAQGLNDITVDANGTVYVSDSRTGKIWRLKNHEPELYLENVQGVNGLKAVGSDLYIGAGKKFLKANKNKELSTVAELPQGIDGIEPVGNGDFILTAWSGYIFYLTAKGEVTTLLETHQDKINTADIGFDPQKRIVYVPTFLDQRVVAYRLR